MTNKRILVLSNSLTGGGAEAVARLMVQQLTDAVVVLFENEAGIEVAGRRIWVASRRHQGGALVTLLTNLWRLVVIQWVKLVVRPAITISHLEGPNFANVLTAFGGKRTLFVHNSIWRSYQEKNSVLERLKLRLVEMLYYRADRMVGVSPDICRELTESFNVQRNNVMFVPNPIDRGAIENSSCEIYGDFRDNLCKSDYLINVASLTAQKNQELLIRVYHQLINDNEQHSDLKLVLLGDGEKLSRLCNLCMELKLSFYEADENYSPVSKQVYFLGHEKKTPILYLVERNL